MSKVVALDLDGTLVHTMPALEQIAVPGLMALGSTEEEARAGYRQTAGMSFAYQVDELWPLHPERAAVVEAFEQAKVGVYQQATPFPDTRYALALLRDRGWTPVIVTSTRGSLAEELVERLGLGIDVSLASSKVEALHACKASAFVGDVARDEQLAFAFGIDFVGVDNCWSSEYSQGLPEAVHSITRGFNENDWHYLAEVANPE